MSADLTDEQREALEAISNSASPEGTESVVTAFLVVQYPSGQWAAYADYEDKNVLPQRKAIMDDFVAGAANITQSCQVQQAAMHTLIAMNQQAQAMQQQMEAQKVAKTLDLSAMRNRG